MKLVDGFFVHRVSSTLYHYTGISGLLGMVKTNTLWASHVYYLNDSREILYASDQFRHLLVEKAAHAHGMEREFMRRLVEWLPVATGPAYHMFVFSLSEERSLLSQWRSYTPHGKAASLGFSPTVLNQVLQLPGFKVAKCLYEREEHRALLEDLLELFLISFEQQRSKSPSEATFMANIDDFLEPFRDKVLQVLSIIKHSEFREEKEWRIVSPYFSKYTVPEIKFREGASMLMPYIEIDLPPPSEDDKWFDEVVLGPSQEINLSHEALSSFLSNKKICNYTVTSGIPYRKWYA